MSDNIMSMFEGGRKSTGNSGDFYSVADQEIYRVDFRWLDGMRASLPYGHLHEILYVHFTEVTTEEVRLHFPGFSAVRFIGRQLLPLYEAFLSHRVAWVRERGKEEDVPGGSLSIERIQYYPLTDWEVDHAMTEARRADWSKGKQD